MEDKNKKLIRINDCGPYFLKGGGNIYDTTIFKQFFESDDSRVLGWAENVYDKLENANILPAFIRKKDNEDFRALWFTVAKMFAFITIYARQFNEIGTNKILFEAFINNKGLVTNLVDSQEQMEYLFNNYLEEYAKRGKLDIVGMSGDILGEFLRLIRYSDKDEFIFALLQPENTGWCLGWSSPTWEKTQLVANVTKAYEFTKDIVDISKYPLLGSSFVYPVQDRNGNDDIVNGITFTGQQPVGIDGTQDLSKLIVVDPNLSYEISFFLKKASDAPSLVKFGVVGYNEDKTQTFEMQVMENGGWAAQGSNMFHTDEYLELPNDNMYYYIRGILFSTNERYYNAPALTFPSGRALSLPSNVRYIAVQIIQERSSVDDTYVYLYDFKVKPLYLPFSQGYFGEKNIIATYFKNNSYQSKDSLDEYTKNFLVSYKNVLGSEIIPFYEGEKVYNICFKVFSTKYIYLQDATIDIFGQSFKTDVNGECVIQLPKGEFVYTVTAKEEQFQPYNSVLNVNQDTVQYVQILGDSFQWTVTFQVTGVDDAPLQGATITMNNQTQITSTRGIAFFNVFKGYYSYKVSADGYYDLEKNINVQADTLENVQMEEVPYKNVSFRVRDGVEPVVGATVVVNVDDVDQTGTTNVTGVATGFVMKPGTYSYVISKSGYITQRAEFTIQDNAVIDVNIQKIPKYNVTFNVTYNDLPLENAFVTFNSVTLSTNKQGQVTFSEINGTYNYTVSKDDFLDETGQVTVNGADTSKTVAIQPKMYNLSFHVVNGVNPVVGASIMVGTETKVTDDKGDAVFVRPSATYNWTVTAPGMYKKQGFTTINKKDTLETVDMMFVTYDITFVVRSAGQPLRGASVILDSQELVTNTNGQVVFNKRAGEYEYSVSAEGFTGQDGKITVTNANVQQNIELTMITGNLTVKVVNENNVAIPNATVTVNNETKSTNVEGVAGIWTLPPKQYNYVVAAPNYNDKSGVVTVSKDGTDLTVQMKLSVAPTYDITFNVYSSGASISNAQIYIGEELVAITNSSGNAMIKREAGQYTYRVVADYFEPYSGTITVVTSQQVNVNLIRLTSTVKFVVKDIDTSDFITNAVVLFNNEVQNTDSSGEATFLNVVQGQSLSYVITKLPPYKNAQGTILINEMEMTKEVYMGEITYSTFFNIKDPSGNAMKNVSCQIGSFSAITGEDGTAVIDGLKNGNYEYKCFTNGYESLSGEVVIFNQNAYLNLIMYKLKANILVTVNDTLGQPVSGASVTSGDIHGVTDSTGRTTLSVDEGTYTFNVSQDSFLDETFNITVGSGDAVEQTVTFQDCCSIDIQLLQPGRITLPIRDNFSGTPGALRVKWGDGSTTSAISYHDYAENGVYRIVFNYNNTDNVLYWSSDFYANALFKSSLLRVVSWFLSKSTVMEKGGFKDCTAFMSQQKWNRFNIRGTAEEMYMGCTSLTGYPAGNLGFATSCKRIFRESGMASTVNLSDVFQDVTAPDFSEAFYGCNIIGLTGSFPQTISLCISIFESCLSLVNVAVDIFTGCKPSIVTRAFALSRVESTVSMNIATSGDASYCYYGCTSLSRMVTRTISSTGNVNLAHIFDSCPSLASTVNADIFDCSTTNFSHAFYGCTKLNSLENIIPSQGITGTADYAFSLTGIVTIPYNIFTGILGKDTLPVTFAHGFEGCSVLTYIGGSDIDNNDWTRSPFYDTNITDMSYCFRNCTILKQNPMMFNASDSVTDHSYLNMPIWTCTKWDYAFEGCTMFGDNINSSPTLRIEGAEYKMWNVHNIQGSHAPAEAVGCFRNCAALTDFSVIPSTWK